METSDSRSKDSNPHESHSLLRHNTSRAHSLNQGVYNYVNCKGGKLVHKLNKVSLKMGNQQ